MIKDGEAMNKNKAHILRLDTIVDNKESSKLTVYSDFNFIGIVNLEFKNTIVSYGYGLYVHEDFRRQGIGTSLIKECFRISEENGCEAFSIVLSKDNIDIKNFYTRLGFIVSYQYDNGDLLMTKVLSKVSQ